MWKSRRYRQHKRPQRERPGILSWHRKAVVVRLVVILATALLLLVFVSTSAILASRQLLPVLPTERPRRPGKVVRPIPSCFLPNRTHTEALVAAATASVVGGGNDGNNDDDDSKRHWNVVNLGMPKMGSTSLYHFFRCSNITANHWRTTTTTTTTRNSTSTADEVVLIGECMRDAYLDHQRRRQEQQTSGGAATVTAIDLVRACRFGAQALTQIDVALSPERCVVPQVTYLPELISSSAAQTMFLLPFRPVDDWRASLYHQVRPDGSRLLDRLQHCLPRHDDGNNHDDHLAQVWCNHVTTVRKLVPRDRLLELDLTDHDWTAAMLSQFYGSSTDCWTQSNRRHEQPSRWKNWFFWSAG